MLVTQLNNCEVWHEQKKFKQKKKKKLGWALGVHY
jgi:hypothetical protein